jgi:hypothetical protein
VTPYRKAPTLEANRFAQAMTLRTDEELVAIVRAPADEWEPEALDAAHAELEARRIPPELREQIHDEVAHVEEKARVPLQTPAKAVSFAAGLFLLPGLFVVLPLARRYRGRDEARKATDVLRWYVYGVAGALASSVAYVTCGAR